MNIVQINCVYNTGSTGKIVKDLHYAFTKKGHKSYVLYGRGKKSHDSNVFKISSEFEAKIHSLFSKLFGVDFGYSCFSTKRAIRLIKKLKPDIVHLHCLNGHFINVYQLICFLKKSGIKTVLTIHAEIMHTAGCEHAVNCEKWIDGCYDCTKIKGLFSRFFRDDAKRCYALMKNAFKDFNRMVVVGVSNWLTNRALKSSIFHNCKFATVFNGLDTGVFKYKNEIEPSLEPHYKGIILHVTPNFNHPLKGGVFMIELAKHMQDYKFIVIGSNVHGDLPPNVCSIGKIMNQDCLANYYSSSNVTLLTSLRETFSMVVAESLCCGTPVVGFEAGGPESISLKEYSEFVKYGDLSMLEAAIRHLLEKKFDRKQISVQAQNKYSKENMANSYLLLYKSDF